MKRFTETQKWEDPWFRRLPVEMKLLWQWLCDRCDNAGIIDPDLDLASFQIGYPYPTDTLSKFEGRIIQIPCGKWFIPKFIEFQYGSLSNECKAHKPIFQSLQKHGLDENGKGIDRVSIGYSKGIDTLQEKEKEKDKEESAPPKLETSPKSRGSVDEFKTYASELGLPSSDGEFLHNHFCEGDWKRGKQPIKDWKAAMRKWQTAGWLPSLKQNGKPANRPTNEPLAYQKNGFHLRPFD